MRAQGLNERAPLGSPPLVTVVFRILSSYPRI
jgi:hypothetical protein